MESDRDPPVYIEQARVTDIDILMFALDEAARKGHLRTRFREEVLQDIQQYYKLKIGNILCGCFQLIPGKEEVTGSHYIELGAVLRCLSESLDTKKNRDTLIDMMVIKARETAKTQSMNLLSITDHKNLIKRYIGYGAQEAGTTFPERQRLSPTKTLLVFG